MVNHRYKSNANAKLQLVAPVSHSSQWTYKTMEGDADQRE
jgi:hypothetical protein